MKQQFQEIFQAASWYNATTLTERIAAWCARGRPSANGDINRELAERRFKHRLGEAPFNKEDFFARRLAQEEISEETLKQLLGEPAETVQGRQTDNPDWLLKLQSAYSNDAEDGSEPELPAHRLVEFITAKTKKDDTENESVPDSQHDEQFAGFLNLVRPLMRQGLAELRDGIHTLAETFSHVPFDPNTVVALLFARLPGKLLPMLSRTLVLELNVARLQGQLAGETAEARFINFVERLRDPGIALALLQEYPVLARQLVDVNENWLAFSLKFLRHLCEDWQAIRKTFSPRQPGALKKLQGDRGDSHRSGRSVIIAEFDSGFKIVYKPRSMAVELHFQQLLQLGE